jgi:hypothetical protein
MRLHARISEIEKAVNNDRDFLTIYVRGVISGFIGTDPLDPKLNQSPHMGETFDGFVERVRNDAIAAGKNYVAIFGHPRDCGNNPY